MNDWKRQIVITISDAHVRQIIALLAKIAASEVVGAVHRRGDSACSGMNAAVSSPGASGTTTRSLTIEQAMAGWRDWLTANGKTDSTYDTYRRMIDRAAKANAWVTVDQITLESVASFLAARTRGDHVETEGGKAWGNSMQRTTVHALNSLTEYLRKVHKIPNPLCDLAAPRRLEPQHKHPLTVAEARAFMLQAVMLHGARKQPMGSNAPLCEYFKFYTGLRPEEVCHVEWTDLSLDAELPGLRCRLWNGNKAKRKDWLPLRPSLVMRLREWRKVTPGPKVFPQPTSDETWEKIRTRAGLPKLDEDGRKYAPHSTRASFITWLGRFPEIQEGMRLCLARHKSLSEETYTVRDKADMIEAVNRLEEIWPESLPESPRPPKRNKPPSKAKNPPVFGESAESSPKTLACEPEISDTELACPDDQPPRNNHRSDARAGQAFLADVGGVVGYGAGPPGELAPHRSRSPGESPVYPGDLEDRAVIELLGISQTLRDYLARRPLR